MWLASSWIGLGAALAHNAPKPRVAPTSAEPHVRLELAYREPADRFEILDNASDWWPGYADRTYREHFEKTFGVSEDDARFFARYRELREKHFDRTGQDDPDPRQAACGLFTDRAVLRADPVGFAFYESATMAEAFERVSHVVDAVEVEFLRSFYAHFAARLDLLTGETRGLTEASLERTRASLARPGLEAYLDDLCRFFGVTERLRFTALYVWWPDTENVRANPNGPFLLLRVRPAKGERIDSADVVVHESVHVLSAMQPQEQKRRVTDAILAAAPHLLEHARRLEVFEEPLATILGNIEFRRRFQPERFSWSRRWYGKPWVDLSARVLHPAVTDALASQAGLGGPFTKEAAALCAIVENARSEGTQRER